MIDVTATSTEELLALRADLTKVSPLTFADQARAILRAGYIAAYLAGKKNAVPPTTNAEQGAPDPYNPEDDLESDPMDLDVESDDEYDPALDEGDDSDLEDAVSGASDKTDDALIGLGAMMMGGAASAKMLDAWLGTYSAGLNPLYEQGFHAGLTDQGTIEQATWQAETDPATCSDCLALDGMTWVGAEIDAAMPHPGDSQFGGRTACGPNCFVEGTLVEGRFVSGMRSWYVGELVELRTMRGHRLTVTPNHPIATPSGFVPAHSLVEGDYVLSQALVIDSPQGLDMENGPAAIEQVLESLKDGPSAWSGEWEPRSVDLHGDAIGVKGNVYVVGSDRKLLRRVDAASREDLRQFRFVSPNMGVGMALTEGSGPVPESFRGQANPLGRLPGSPEQVTGRFVPGGPARYHPRATVTDHDAVSSEDGIDSGTWNLIGLSEYLPRDAKLVETADDIPGQGVRRAGAMPPVVIHPIGRASQIDASLSEPAGYSVDADAEFIGDMARRFSPFISRDQVVEVIRRDDFAGHVFDLGTEGGWLSAGGILAGNCRCAIEYTVVPTDEAVYSWGGFDDPTVEAFSTADLLKAHSILRLLKYSDDQLRDDHGMWTDGGSQGEAVITLVASAQSHAPAVTSDLRAITAAYGGNLDATVGPRHTLQFVTKTEASTREKMDKLKHMGYSVAEAKTMMRDNLRYTIVADRGNWTRTVEGAVTTLKADGYTPLRATDHWRETEGYAGLHTNWQTPDGQQTFELQFHTQDSLETKELISHPLYEKMRDLEANDAQLQVYRDKIDAAWTSVRADPPPDTSPFLRSVFGRVGKT